MPRTHHSTPKFTVSIYSYAPPPEGKAPLAVGSGSSERVAAMRAVESLSDKRLLTGKPVVFQVLRNR